MAARSRAAVLLVLCAVLWSTGGRLVKKPKRMFSPVFTDLP